MFIKWVGNAEKVYKVWGQGQGHGCTNVWMLYTTLYYINYIPGIFFFFFFLFFSCFFLVFFWFYMCYSCALHVFNGFLSVPAFLPWNPVKLVASLSCLFMLVSQINDWLIDWLISAEASVSTGWRQGLLVINTRINELIN